MSELHQKAVRLISELSDDNISFLIEIIQRLMPQEICTEDNESIKLQLFRDWILSGDMKQYLPDDFDLKKELEKARQRDMVVLIDKCYNEAIEKGKGFC